MFQTFRNAWKIPELKNRLLFTLAILVVYRLGCAIPVPFVSGSALTQMFANGDMLSYLNMMSGGALARCTLFALGVTPYINASIIVQLLTVAIPALENLAKEADGQQKLQQINRYAGAVVALIMSIGYYFVIRNMGALKYVSGGAGIFAAIVNVADLEAAFEAGEVVDTEALKAKGLVKKTLDGVKVLGNGELTKALTVKAAAYSASAKEKIEKAGGKAEVM